MNYDGAGRLTGLQRSADPADTGTPWTYNHTPAPADGQACPNPIPDPQNGADPVTTRRTVVTDSHGLVSTYCIDRLGRVAKQLWNDAAGPGLELSGWLFDARGNVVRGGIERSLLAVASDGTPASGVAEFRLYVDSHLRETQRGACSPPGKANATRCARRTQATFSFDPSSLGTEGRHTVVVEVSDLAGNVARQQFDLIFDEPRFVVATSLEVDPDGNQQQIRKEWADLTSEAARIDEPDAVATNSVGDCDIQVAGCFQYRELSPGQESTFVRYVGTGTQDDRVPRVSELIDTIETSPDYQGAGPLSDVLATGQAPPPGSGARYAYYDRTSPIEADDGDLDGDDAGPVIGELRYRVVVERDTGLPLRETTYSSDSELLYRRIWTYEPTVVGSADLEIPAPPNPLLSKVVQYEPLRTATRQAAFVDASAVSREGLCGAQRYHETLAQREIGEPASVASSLERTVVSYEEKDQSGDCVNDGNPEVVVRSANGDSGWVDIWRDAYPQTNGSSSRSNSSSEPMALGGGQEGTRNEVEDLTVVTTAPAGSVEGASDLEVE